MGFDYFVVQQSELAVWFLSRYPRFESSNLIDELLACGVTEHGGDAIEEPLDVPRLREDPPELSTECGSDSSATRRLVPTDGSVDPAERLTD